MAKASEFNYFIENKARELLNAIEPDSKTAECCDGIFADGRTLEVKNFSGAKPSLGTGSLEGFNNVRKAVEAYCKADVYCFYLGSNKEYDENKMLVLNREKAVEWLMLRVTFDRDSTANGGRKKMRVNKCGRTSRGDEAFIRAGYTIY